MKHWYAVLISHNHALTSHYISVDYDSKKIVSEYGGRIVYRSLSTFGNGNDAYNYAHKFGNEKLDKDIWTMDEFPELNTVYNL